MTRRRSCAALRRCLAFRLGRHQRRCCRCPRAIIVFDPSNYAQNVLRAAHARSSRSPIRSPRCRAEAQMLINQARNLASLPYSSLQQLQRWYSARSSFWGRRRTSPTTSTQIDRSLQQKYSTASMSASDQQLVADAHSRWQEHRRRSAGCHARAGRRRQLTSTPIVRRYRRWSGQPVGDRRAPGDTGRQSASRARSRRSSSLTSAVVAANDQAQALPAMPSGRPQPNRGREQRQRF